MVFLHSFGGVLGLQNRDICSKMVVLTYKTACSYDPAKYICYSVQETDMTDSFKDWQELPGVTFKYLPDEKHCYYKNTELICFYSIYPNNATVCAKKIHLQ